MEANMQLHPQNINELTGYFDELGLLPSNARQHLEELRSSSFAFSKQMSAAESIHLHIKVPSTEALPHEQILAIGGEPQNEKEGYIKYAFKEGIHFIFSSIPVSQEERAGLSSFQYPHLDHIGIDIRDESEEAYNIFQHIPFVAAAHKWSVRKQGGEGQKVYCCHVTVNEKYWVYPQGGVYWEFAFGQLLISTDKFGCDLRPADPALGLSEESVACCGSSHNEPEEKHSVTVNGQTSKNNTYYNPSDLKKFGNISEFHPQLAKVFFDYYGDVFKGDALSAREKSLIALAVAHAVQCPYCIDAYTTDSLSRGWSTAQMMEAVHVAAAIRGGATLVHSVQMMNKAKATMEEKMHIKEDVLQGV